MRTRALQSPKKPRVETRDHAAREPAASCRGSLGGPAPAWNQPGPPGLALTQEAPGGNPGTCCTRTRGVVPRFAWRACARLESTRPSGPGAHTRSPGWKPGDMLHANPRRRAAVRLAGLHPLGINPALRAWYSHKKPRVETRDHAARKPAASCRGSLGGPAPAWIQPGPPGLALTQEAPGGNPGTPGLKTIPPSMPHDGARFAVRTRSAWHTGRDATRSPPAPAGGFLCERQARRAGLSARGRNKPEIHPRAHEAVWRNYEARCGRFAHMACRISRPASRGRPGRRWRRRQGCRLRRGGAWPGR